MGEKAVIKITRILYSSQGDVSYVFYSDGMCCGYCGNVAEQSIDLLLELYEEGLVWSEVRRNGEEEMEKYPDTEVVYADS